MFPCQACGCIFAVLFRHILVLYATYHLRKYITVVKDKNVGKQDLQGFLFGWSGISCEVELPDFVLVWAFSFECGKLINSHLHLVYITMLPSSWD